jgi:putative endonuclease
MNERAELGKAAESAAESYLAGKGFRIVDRGWRARFGEVDLIALDGDTLVFVEVKARSSGAFGPAEAAVDARKQGRIVKTALAYLQRRRHEGPVRFDVVAFQGGAVRHIEGAFSAEGWTR